MPGNTRKKGDGVLVVGAGAAGIRASLDLAEMGCKVYLCDKSPSLGGVMVLTDRWFPDNHCGMCKMLPIFARDDTSQYCLRRGLIHPNIRVLPLTEVQKVQGEAGDFTVTLKSAAAGVNHDLCIGCAQCVSVCPAEASDAFNEGLARRKAIYLRNPWMPSNSYVIDWAACNRCGACVEKCPTTAIDLNSEDVLTEIKCGSIILSTGFEEFDPARATQYGHRRYPNVVTSIELERLMSQSGPTQGRLVRPSDHKVPDSVAFLQCVGSRDMKRDYCSYACCMYALKEAILIKKTYPQTEVEIFYMDMRTFGKGYYRYYQQAVEMGIKFTRCRIPVVKQDFKSGDLLMTTISEDGQLRPCRFGMLVLSVGQTPSPRFEELADSLGVKLNESGFCETSELDPVDTNKKGVYVCGSASGPKDITDAMVTATAAAGRAVLFALRPDRKAAEPGEVAVGMPKTAVFLCDCGKEVASALDMDALLQAAKTMPSVVHVERVPYLCHSEAVKSIRAKMEQCHSNRAVLATCAPFISRKLSSDIAVDPCLIQVVNLREEVAWPHRNAAAATSKARALIAMAVERLRLQDCVPLPHIVTKQSALVIGGGLAGMTASLSIASMGYEVHLVERDADLGGRARDMHLTPDGNDVQILLRKTIQDVENNELIHVYRGTEVVGVDGCAGDFKVRFAGRDGAKSVVEVGSIVVSTGADDLKPDEYLYGQNERVLTQGELEKKIAAGELGDLKSVAMIQCVGSRDEKRPYCSRFCCSQALMNALRIKEIKPQAEIVVFYRDLMSYGFIERQYLRAREKGILFARYDPERKPEVRAEGGKLKVTAKELAVGGTITLEPDLLVLSTPVVPGDQKRLTKLLSVDLDEDGFFDVAEAKFRPVDFLRDGIFVCGLAHSPRSLTESLVQAQAAAQRACCILSRGKLTSGRMVSEVKQRWCAGCEMCISVCPYGARVKDEKQGAVVVLEALCQGCGTCVVSCPSGAASLRGLSDRQVISMTDAAL
ncbi:MAG: FAD-dependent oxidoreductase [Dehalococcoidia bacterium]|nr:FAD-dependent oxidoreductase [Dehalococcoidia bacterium]